MTPSTAAPDIRVEYLDACNALKGLAQLVVAADAARFDSPPGAVYGKGTDGDMAGISNPTLDTVLDPRRMGLSDEVRATATLLRSVAANVREKTASLDRALARWEGDVPTPA